MAAYSQDLRDRVLRAFEQGESPTFISRRFEVSRVWVYKIWHRYQQNGERTSRKIGGYRRSKLQGSEEILRAWIAEKHDLTLVEICERLQAQGIGISPNHSSICRQPPRVRFTDSDTLLYNPNHRARRLEPNCS